MNDEMVVKDVAYLGHAGSLHHRLDLFLPDRRKYTGAAPVVIHVHGGGWQRGSKSSEWRGAPVFGRTCASHGVVVVCVGYRLAPPSISAHLMGAGIIGPLAALLCLSSSFFRWHWGRIGLVFAAAFVCSFLLFLLRGLALRGTARHPGQVRDVARAVGWVHRNIQTYYPDADLDNVFISGHLAGAHLAALAALDGQWLREANVPPKLIKGVVVMSGVYSLDCPLDDNACALKNVYFRQQYTTSAFGYSAAVWRAASPLTHVGPYAPPFLVLSAERDLGLEVDAKRFVERLRNANVKVVYHTVPRTSHATMASRFPEHEAHMHVLTFVRGLSTGSPALSSPPVVNSPSSASLASLFEVPAASP